MCPLKSQQYIYNYIRHLSIKKKIRKKGVEYFISKWAIKTCNFDCKLLRQNFKFHRNIFAPYHFEKDLLLASIYIFLNFWYYNFFFNAIN